MVKDIVMSIVTSIAISIKSFPAYFHVIKTVYQPQLLQLHLQLLQLSILLINVILTVIPPVKDRVIKLYAFLTIFLSKNPDLSNFYKTRLILKNSNVWWIVIIPVLRQRRWPQQQQHLTIPLLLAKDLATLTVTKLKIIISETNVF